MQRSSSEYYPRVILALMMWAQFVVPLALFSVRALAPLLRDALHLSREQLSALTALYHAGAALVAMPVGWLADRYGMRDVLIAVQAVSGLALVAIPFPGRQHSYVSHVRLPGRCHGVVHGFVEHAGAVAAARHRAARPGSASPPLPS